MGASHDCLDCGANPSILIRCVAYSKALLATQIAGDLKIAVGRDCLCSASEAISSRKLQNRTDFNQLVLCSSTYFVPVNVTPF